MQMSVPTAFPTFAKGPLASTSQVTDQSFPHERIDLAECLAGITFAKVVAPAGQVLIEFYDQLWDRLEALPGAGHLLELVPLSLQRLAGRTEVQIFPVAATQVAVVSERVAQKVQTAARLVQLRRARLVGVDLQVKATLQRLLHEPRDPLPD